MITYQEQVICASCATVDPMYVPLSRVLPIVEDADKKVRTLTEELTELRAKYADLRASSKVA